MCYTSATWNPKDHHLWSCFFLFGGGGSFFPKLWRIFLFGGWKAFWVSTFAAFKWNPGIQDSVLYFRNMEPERPSSLELLLFVWGGGSFFPKDHHLWRIFLFGGGSFFPKDHQLWRIFVFGGWTAFWVSTFAAFKWNPGIQDNVLYFRNMEPERPSSLELLLFVWGGKLFPKGPSSLFWGEAFSQRTISSGESFCLGGGKLFGFPHSLPLSGIQESRIMCYTSATWNPKDHHLWSCFFLFGGGGKLFPKGPSSLENLFVWGGGSFFPKDHQLWRIFLFGGWKAFWVSTFAAFKWNPGIQDNVLYFRNMEPERPSSLELLLFVWGGGEAFSQRTIICGESFCLGGKLFPKGPSALENLFVWGVESFLGFHIRCL